MEQNHFATYPSLRNRHIFITGGATGIGESIVAHFVAQESKVSFVDIADEAAKQLVTKLTSQFPNAHIHYHSCDIRNIEQLQSCIEKSISQFGAIKALVNNAASDQRHSIESTTVAYWDNCQNINLRPHFFTAQAVAASMTAAGGGSIINLSSNSYMLMVGGMPGYLTAKAAIVGLTRALARDLGEQNIRVNALLPGWVMTRKQIEMWLTPEERSK